MTMVDIWVGETIIMVGADGNGINGEIIAAIGADTTTGTTVGTVIGIGTVIITIGTVITIGTDIIPITLDLTSGNGQVKV